MTETQKERIEKIRKILESSSVPLGPKQIARQINEYWCMRFGLPQGNRVGPLLKLMDDVKRNGYDGTYELKK